MNWKIVREALTFLLAWLMLVPSGPPSGFAKDDAAKNARRASDVKAAVLKLGAGKDARVLLALRDGAKVGGYVQPPREDDFSVRVFCSGNDIPVPFAQIRGLRGLNVATGTKVSTGKGVSEKAAAGLAVGDPCRMRIIQAKRSGPTPLSEAIVAIGFGAFMFVLIVLVCEAAK